MKLVVLFLNFFLWMTFVQAQGYKLENSKLNSQVDIYLFSQEMNAFNFFPMDITHKGSILSNNFDQIFFDRSNHNNYAVLKLDLQYLGSQGVMKLSATDYVCHGSFVDGRPFSLFTSGINKQIVDRICGQINLAQNDVKKNSYSKSQLIYSMIMNTAEAQVSCQETNSMKNINSIQNISTQFSTEAAIQKLGSCLADVLRGSGNVFKGMFDGAKSLLTTSPGELWNGLKKSVGEVRNFVIHLKDEMIKLKNAFSQLNTDLILSIGCTLAGELITSAGITALTGAGATMLSLRVLKIVKSMTKFKNLFGQLNKLSRFGKGKLAEKVLGCGLQ